MRPLEQLGPCCCSGKDFPLCHLINLNFESKIISPTSGKKKAHRENAQMKEKEAPTAKPSLSAALLGISYMPTLLG